MPEMTVNFAGQQLMEASYRGDTLFAPIPKTSRAKAEQLAAKASLRSDGDSRELRNASRILYDEYLKYQKSSIAAFAFSDSPA